MIKFKQLFPHLRSWGAAKARAARDMALFALMLTSRGLQALWRLCVVASRGAMRLPAWLRRRSPRMSLPTILATSLVLTVAALAPQQAPVLLYKLGAVAAAGCLGYLLDVAAFPYAQPSGYLRVDWRDVDSFEDDKPDFAIVSGCERAFGIACLRRAAIICACMLAVALAL